MKAKAIAKARDVNKQAQFSTSSKQRLAAEAAENEPRYISGRKATQEKVKSLFKIANKEK